MSHVHEQRIKTNQKQQVQTKGALAVCVRVCSPSAGQRAGHQDGSRRRSRRNRQAALQTTAKLMLRQS